MHLRTLLYLTLFLLFVAGCNEDIVPVTVTPETFPDCAPGPFPEGTLQQCGRLGEGWSVESTTSDLFHAIRSYAFPCENTVIGGAGAGTFYRSTDGGRSWVITESRYSGGTTNTAATTRSSIDALFAVNPMLIYGAGGDEDIRSGPNAVDTDAVFLTSRDGGLTWTKTYAFGIRQFFDLYFLNESLGYALATGSGTGDENEAWPWLFRTEDGGATWQPVNHGFRRPLGDIVFLNRGGVISFPVELETLDDYALATVEPMTGNVQLTDLPDGVDLRISFANESVGAMRNFTAAYTTTDGGLTWVPSAEEALQTADLFLLADAEHWLTVNIAYDESTQDQEWPEIAFFRVSASADGGATWTTQRVEATCSAFRPGVSELQRTPDGGFLIHTSTESNLITFTP